MNETTVGLIGLLAGSAITGIGWFATAFLNERGSETSRRREAKLRHIRRQIEELYGPLYGLIQRSEIVYDIAREKLPQEKDGSIAHNEFTEENARVWQYFVEEHFLPLNKEMSILIRSKLDLIESATIPQSFLKFFVHEAHYDTLHQLWKTHKVKSTDVEGGSWPPEFTNDVYSSLERLLNRYKQYIEQLGNLD